MASQAKQNAEARTAKVARTLPKVQVIPGLRAKLEEAVDGWSNTRRYRHQTPEFKRGLARAIRRMADQLEFEAEALGHSTPNHQN